MFRRVYRPSISQPEDQNIRHIPLTHGYIAIVDAVDYEWLNQLPWHVFIRNDGKPVARNLTKTMHRVILKLTNPKIGVDHINRNSLDNRRCNLRAADPKQSAMNRGRKTTAKSGYKGVSKARNHWRVCIQKDGVMQHIGMFDCPIEGARAYDKRAIELFGEFAVLNFP